MSPLSEREKRILACWDDITEQFPDGSTEWCIAMTAQAAKAQYGDVPDALERRRDLKASQTPVASDGGES